MKRILFLCLLPPFFLNATILSPEKDSAIVRPKRIAGIYFNLQGNFMNDVTLSTQQMATLWPGVLNEPYSAYPERYGSGPNTQGAVTELGITLGNNPRGKFHTQIGISYNSARSVGRAYGFSYATSIDTLASSAGYPTLYRDSIYNKTYYINYSAAYLGLNVNETYEFRFAKRFGLVLGAGVKAMYSMSPQLSELRTTDQYVYLGADKNPFAQNKSPRPQDYRTETYTSSERFIPGAKNSMLFLANVSAGCNFRLFMLKKSHHSLWLNQSVNSGIDVFKINGLSSISRFYFGISIGLRFMLG